MGQLQSQLFLLTSKMHISSKFIHFSSQQQKEILTVTNSQDRRIIFKIRVNNTNSFSICPGRGLLSPSQSTHIQITFKMDSSCSAKVQLIHAIVPDDHEDSFQKIWAQIDKHDFKEEYVVLTGKGTKSSKEELEKEGVGRSKIISFNSLSEGSASNGRKQVQFKPTESPVYEHESGNQMEKSRSQMSSSSSRQIKKKQSQLLIKEGSQVCGTTLHDVQRTVSAPLHSLTSMTSSKLQTSRFCTLEKELQSERDHTKQLKQRLAQRELKLRYFQSVSQRRVNDSFKDQEEGFRLNNLNLCLLMLICLIFGYFIARTTPSSSL